ncbi:MAG: ATP-binding cassette domain-containing protein [Oscillospiraceae bacterium]|jgi:ABC-2 type transport system ATP-binding protein|nr:ATP-binding cassette domain-containing protein [Oscillospiraceae bacterium]
MIHVEHLCKDFKKTIKNPGLKGSVQALFKPKYEIIKAVNDISFHVPKGEILGFIGPNGAGKSTAIKMLTGILTPTSGSCIINGCNPQKQRTTYVKEIGVVFGQRTQLWWDLPLVETYAVLKEIYEVSDSDFKSRMDFLNEILDLPEFIKSPVRTLSLGQRMRADIAASLLHRPKVVFLDEPTIGLDVVVKDNIRKAINKINREEGTTFILTTHDISDIELLCERIVMIDKGKKMFEGPLKTLKTTYGQTRSMTFEVDNPKSFATLKYCEQFNADPDDITTSFEGNVATVNFNSHKISVGDILNYTLSTVNISDINVKDSDIEEIVRRLYKGGVAIE